LATLIPATGSASELRRGLAVGPSGPPGSAGVVSRTLAAPSSVCAARSRPRNGSHVMDASPDACWDLISGRWPMLGRHSAAAHRNISNCIQCDDQCAASAMTTRRRQRSAGRSARYCPQITSVNLVQNRQRQREREREREREITASSFTPLSSSHL